MSGRAGSPRIGFAPAAAWWRRHWRGPTAALAALAGLALVAFAPAGVVVGTHAYLQHRDAQRAAAQDQLGTQVRDGPVSFVVHKIHCGASREATHGQLCRVTVAARNDGDERVTVPATAQLLHASGGARHRPIGGDPTPFGTLAPGEAATATVTFDLPPHSAATHVEVHAGPYTPGHRVGIGGPPLPLLAAGDRPVRTG